MKKKFAFFRSVKPRTEGINYCNDFKVTQKEQVKSKGEYRRGKI